MDDVLKPILLKVAVCPKCGQKLPDTKEEEVECPHCSHRLSKKDASYRYVWTENHVP